ncbi:MAG: hypothetical protein WEB06_20950 [Actinomycetota bacterium]
MNASHHSVSRRRTGSLLRAAAVFAFAIVLTACGGDEEPGALPTTPGTTPGTSTPTTSGTTSSPPVAFGTPTKIPKTTKPSPSATATGGSIGRLDLTCARGGVDTQGITVQTAPGGPAGFNTLYSDGSSSVDGKSDYKTGYDAKLMTDSSGVFRSVWIPPANAPAGPAIVRVITQDGTFDLVYTLEAGNGSCP